MARVSAVRVSIKDTGPLRIHPKLEMRFDIGVLPEEGRVKHVNSDLTVSEVTAIHEFGAPNIPARAPIRTWADLHAEKFKGQVREELARMVRTQRFGNTTALRNLVEAAARSMKARITGGHIKPKNAKSTLVRKSPERRPLIETKQLVNSIHARLTATFGALRVNLKSK
jgi:hypothetical protein